MGMLYQLAFVQGVHLQRVALSEENVVRNTSWCCVKCACSEQGILRLGISITFLVPIILVAVSLYFAPYAVFAPYAASIFFFIYLHGKSINQDETYHACATDFPALMAMAG